MKVITTSWLVKIIWTEKMPLISGQKPATWNMLACSCIPDLLQKKKPIRSLQSPQFWHMLGTERSYRYSETVPSRNNALHLMVEIWLSLMPDLSGEHQGCCVFRHGQASISSLHRTSLWRHELLQILRFGQSLFEACHSLHDQFQSSTGSSHLKYAQLCMITNVRHPAIHSLFILWVWWGGVVPYRLSLSLCVCPQNLPLTPVSTPTHLRSHPPHRQVHSTMMLLL